MNSPLDTWFLNSIDASNSIKSGELMFTYLDDVVEEIGKENVGKSLLIMCLIM